MEQQIRDIAAVPADFLIKSVCVFQDAEMYTKRWGRC